MSGNDTCSFHITSLSDIPLSTFRQAGMNTGLWGNSFYQEDEDNTPEGESNKTEAGSCPE